MYRNKLNTKLAKQNYYSNQLEHERGNMRNTWKILNSFLRCFKKSPSRKFSNSGIDITDPKQIANGFNQYFANVGPALASSISHSGNDFNHYLQNSDSLTCFVFVFVFVFVLFFKPTIEEEIIKVIKKLGSRKSPGHDRLKSDLVKQIAEDIALPLKIIFNISLHTGSVPDNLKIAKVVPIHKKDNPELLGNYKPVTVLPCFSKK